MLDSRATCSRAPRTPMSCTARSSPAGRPSAASSEGDADLVRLARPGPSPPTATSSTWSWTSPAAPSKFFGGDTYMRITPELESTFRGRFDRTSPPRRPPATPAATTRPSSSPSPEPTTLLIVLAGGSAAIAFRHRRLAPIRVERHDDERERPDRVGPGRSHLRRLRPIGAKSVGQRPSRCEA